ncbi:hypothetical protein EG327_003454 [Venturia inaequalis]|uniref:Uncharacterized protein n=1 Tax=Venturia inaequalis TaxID=5025 RepID=A0A8H3Z6T9_VENIN|nr:hypothetical protein EG327_003454 [Venturia inaequalis]
MLEIRQASIDSLLAVCYAYIDQVEREDTCKEEDSGMKEQCYLLTLGSLVHGFRALDIWRPRRTGACVHQSIASFYNAVKDVKISTLPKAEAVTRKRTFYSNHDECNLMSKMVADLKKVYQAVPTPVDDFQLERISQQAKKGVPLSPEKI